MREGGVGNPQAENGIVRQVAEAGERSRRGRAQINAVTVRGGLDGAVRREVFRDGDDIPSALCRGVDIKRMFGEQIEISGRKVQFALQIFDIALVVGIERRAFPNLKAVDADAVPDPLTARFEERLGGGSHVGGDGVVLCRQEACLSGVA